jgi:hypothetical protein
MGKERGYKPIELIIINHGGAHNDTICIVEQKQALQLSFLLPTKNPIDNRFPARLEAGTGADTPLSEGGKALLLPR